MARSVGMMTFPDFRGFTKTLIVWNVGIFFALLLLGALAPLAAATIVHFAALSPGLVLHGWVWQLVTYSFLHGGVLGTALEMLSIWFLASFLEQNHGPRWAAELYFAGVLGAGLTAVLLTLVMERGAAFDPVFGGGLGVGFTGSFGGIFGLLIAFAVLYGDLQFTLFPLPIAIKAKYLVAVYMLIAIAQVFGESRAYALGQLGGALAGFLFIRYAPRRGMTQATNDWYFKVRNDYYRMRRRNAAKRFEVYMRKQNREVHFDREGKYIDPDSQAQKGKGPNDRSWMN